MRIHTKIEYLWSAVANAYVLVSEEGFDYCPENGLALCKGASSTETGINQQQQQMASQLSSDYGTQFANQSNILSGLTNILNPIAAAGPSQMGYSQGELNSLNSSAIQNSAQAYKTAQQGLQNQQAVQGGGNTQLPSGVVSQNNATLASQGANNESNQLLGIQTAGYQQGNANYNNAVSALGGVASAENPLGYAGASTSALNGAFGGASTIQQQNTAASPWGTIGGILGGALSAGVGGLTGGLGSGLGKSLFTPSSSSNAGSGILGYPEGYGD